MMGYDFANKECCWAHGRILLCRINAAFQRLSESRIYAAGGAIGRNCAPNSFYPPETRLRAAGSHATLGNVLDARRLDSVNARDVFSFYEVTAK
jgi:hypothetical protein